jgi:hypothetical protein
VTDTAVTRRRYDVTIVRGGRPDDATLAAIEQAVLTVRAKDEAKASAAAPAWRRASLLEATTMRRITSRAALMRDVRG